ncbi:MAG: COX15/CtaA family protein [Pseudomonadota bacterium]|nr:COX15/CtaA family protein [Pseudomonadota bacterium]
MVSAPLVDFSPALRMAITALVIALMPLSWVWLRQRGADRRTRLAALTTLTLFLTFDLIVFGAFTRLSDSGLGCPDWPGCYGAMSPFHARTEIDAAQTASAFGPVTWAKAWIEMIHRYLAMTVGVLILVITAFAWAERKRLPYSPWWPTLTLLWVVVQGLFGKYTVTLKLYPAVVTAHLLGGLALLALLALQHAHVRAEASALPARLRGLAFAALAALVVQIALGGWVSTNYAVLACTGFPACNGQWWPAMDFQTGFTLLRELGRAGHGGLLEFDALVAIQMAHRLFAIVATLALATLSWKLWRSSEGRTHRFGAVLALLLLAQLASGLSNVVLGWPLVAALGHSAGAAALVLTMVLLLARSTVPQATRFPARQAASTPPRSLA